MSLLPWTIYLTFIGAAATLLAGASRPGLARVLALATAVGGLAITAVAWLTAGAPHGVVTLVDVPWVAQFGARYHLSVDGISLVLVALTGIAATAGVLFSWNIEKRTHEFFAFFLLLIAGVYGVFLSADVFLFFVYYEIAIVPKYFLIANWGSTRREYGAMKLVLYSFVGSSLVLAGVLWAHAVAGGDSFDLAVLANAHYTLTQQIGMFSLVFFGFAFLAGLFPFHTWAPTGHVAAPTGASMLLAGVVMKLGAYGCLRVALPLFPLGFAALQPILAWLALAGILYAGVAALIQEDLKFVIAYSSVSHMGFVLLGLAAGNAASLNGAVLQMFSHGVIAGLLFAVVGRIVYERTHTRKLQELRAMPLLKLLPFGAGVFVLAGMASMGMPGFSGFPAELTVLIGTWGKNPVWALTAGVGIIFAGAFTLRAVYLTFFGNNGAEAHEHPHGDFTITWPEYAGAVLLLAVAIVVGLRPDLLAAPISDALQAPLFHSFFAAAP